MDVLCFLPDLGGGGAERSMVNLVNALPGCGVAPILAAADAAGPARKWLDNDAGLVDLGAGRTRRALRPLRRLIRARRPAVLFSTMVHANIIAAAANWRLPGAPRLVLRETNSHRARGDLGAALRRGVRWAYHRADRVVALSTGVGRELIDEYGLDGGRVVTIHNPVDVAALGRQAERARKEPPPWSEARGFGGANGPVLLGSGRLTRQKGFDLLIRALARLDEGTTRLVLLGEGEDRSALEALARSLGVAERVQFAGFVDDPVSWQAHADLFVLPSRWEGFGHVIVEAMAAGTPVIAADCPYGPADIVRDGETGLLIEPGNVDRLAAAIGRLLAAPDEARRLAGAAEADCRRFEARTIAARYAELFREIEAAPAA